MALEMDDDALLEALGVDVQPVHAGGRTAREERIVAGFEDILRFHQTHGRAPRHGAEDVDIFERLYAVRLQQLRQLPEARALLADLDGPGLLSGDGPTMADVQALSEDDLLAALGVDGAQADDGSDITRLRHVRSAAEKKAAEAVAKRTPCSDFAPFKPLFDEATVGLKTGRWTTKPFVKDASIALGDFFIIGGQVAYVAEMADGSKTKDGRDNPRLRVIFDNSTEGDLLLRSLSRSLYPDGDTPVGRRLIRVDDGPLFGHVAGPDDLQTGTIYVLRSQSAHPFVAEHRELIHKIGVTGGRVEDRIAGANKDATYLLADVEVAATYQLHNLQRSKLEAVFHKLFAAAQLDLTIEDRFGQPVKPREWFLVPLHVIDEAVERIRNGSITAVQYDPATATLFTATPSSAA
jgi:hypothetical protein